MPEHSVLDSLKNGLIESSQPSEFRLSEFPGRSGFPELDVNTLALLFADLLLSRFEPLLLLLMKRIST